MLCSNCGVIETHESITCENGHFLCGSCVQLANGMCMVCSKRIFRESEKDWIHSDKLENWTPEMFDDWAAQNEFADREDTAIIRGDISVQSEDSDAPSMHLLYSTDRYNENSPQHSGIANISRNQKWNQAPAMNDIYSAAHDRHFSKRNKPDTMRFLGPPALSRKDTRQNLVEQTKEKIREKIMEEIFNSFKSDPRSHIRPGEYAYVKQYHTIGVSTESTPKLLPVESIRSMSKEVMIESTKFEDNAFDNKPQEFLVMNVDTTDITCPPLNDALKQKSSPFNTDIKLQQVMGTLLESVPEKPIEEQNFYKFLHERLTQLPPKKLEEILSSIYDEDESPNVSQICTQNEFLPNRSIDLSVMSNSHRAFYSPPIPNQAEMTPSPQFQPIINKKNSRNNQKNSILDAGTLNIPRSPIICPISTCKRSFFLSDFTKHIAVDHTKVPIERITPSQCKNFFLDPKLIHVGVSRCQVLFLVKDKIRNLGHEKFKDFIPILVMTTKINLLELFCTKYRSHSELSQKGTQNFIMIWLTGIMPQQLPIFCSLTVWARSGYMPICHIVQSGRLYSVRNTQCPKAVRSSGQMLLLSEQQVDLLTNRGRHMLELQIEVH